jgi:hypothetical protein
LKVPQILRHEEKVRRNPNRQGAKGTKGRGAGTMGLEGEIEPPMDVNERDNQRVWRMAVVDEGEGNVE